MTNEEKILDQAKIGFMFKPNSVFITSVLFSLKLDWSDLFPTAATDGTFLKINQDWFCKLTNEERVGLLAHEAWHVALMHPLRGEGKNQTKYGMAADYYINLMLVDAGYTLPPNGLFDRKYRGLCTEEIYNLLEDHECPDDFDHDIIPNKDIDKDDLDNILIRASIQSKQQGDGAGTIPEEIERYIDDILNPKLPWEVILDNFITNAMGMGNFTWSKPNRRFLPEFYLPSTLNESMEKVVFAIDASASVSKEEFTAYLAEINAIKERLNPKETIIMDFDTKIKEIRVLKPEDSIAEVQLYGGGGTRINPVMSWIVDNEPELVIIFTDGDFPPCEPDINSTLFWVINNHPSFESNIGNIIHFEV